LRYTKPSLGIKSINITKFNSPSFFPPHIKGYVLWSLPTQKYVYNSEITSTMDIIPWSEIGVPLTGSYNTENSALKTITENA
jgi:hypothetical protein